MTQRVNPVLTLLLGAVSAVSICGSCLAADAGATTTPAAVPDSGAAAAARTLWLVGGSIACALVLGGIWFYVRANRHPSRPARTPARTPQAHPATPRSERHSARPAAKPFAAAFKPKFDTLPKPLNGKSQGAQRRKMFDYNRYYLDLMGAVSGNVTQLEVPPVAKSAPAPAPSSEPPVTEEAAPPGPVPTPAPQPELPASPLETIEKQKRIIEEQQKRLEEKDRLLAQKDALLRLHTRLPVKKAA